MTDGWWETAVRTADVVRYAGGALAGHRLRTALTVTAMAIGIAAVVALTALGEGARRYVVGEFENLGSNLLIVIPGKVETTGAIPYGGVVHDLTLDDARAVAHRVSGVVRVAPVSLGTEAVRFGDRRRSVPVIGTTAEYAAIRRLAVGSGRFLSPGEARVGRTEVVLGPKVARELFGPASPLGRVVRIGPWRYRVVGVLAPKGRALGFDFDDLVIVPVATAMKMLDRRSLFRILVEARDASELEGLKRRVGSLLRRRHRSDDVTIITQDAVLSAFSSILNALTLALAAIASVSLLVAGIGIMNVMLVSVTERRAEIGLLRALGAGRGQVLGLFLAEAVALSVLGGVLGLGMGVASIAVFTRIYPSFPAVPPGWALAAAGVLSVAVGTVFGVWPARRATRLDPVRALTGR